MTTNAARAIILQFIRETETGRIDNTAYETLFGHRETRLPKPLTKMTIAEVQAGQKSWAGWRSAKSRTGSSAAGAYQIMRATLNGLKVGMDQKLLFSPSVQDMLGNQLLDRRGFKKWAAGKLSGEGFALGLAKEWASFPVLRATQGAHRSLLRGQSYYEGDSVNKALVSPEEVERLLSKAQHALGSPTEPTHTITTPPGRSIPKGPLNALLGLLRGLFSLIFGKQKE